jgi:hypothetical protein
VIEKAGLAEVEFGPRVETFDGAPGEARAKAYGTHGVAMRGRRPPV